MVCHSYPVKPLNSTLQYNMEKTAHVYPGHAYPLGASWNGEGVNFALYTENASKVELCLFEKPEDSTPIHVIELKSRSHRAYHGFVPGITPGQLYGYRVYGPYDPQNGHRFNHHKLLIDPYAKALAGTLKWDDALFGYQCGHPDEDLSFSETDSAPFIPKSVVIAPNFDWEGDAPLKIPYHKSVIYEAHVKGLTQSRPDIPENIRGTYAGIAHPVMIEYLQKLGITAIELMPVHAFVSDRHLVEKGLTNYWGYNTIGFFAPDARYSSSGIEGQQVTEFKNMVKALHKAGIEVILDVVYNHTAEGNHLGPTLSFKGIDNSCYYRLSPENKRYYFDYTGTGNTLNANLPSVLRLIMDSLRYWIEEMHVDGFRFDLAATLARELHEVNQLSAFFDIIYQDPVISQVKLIAEPWDVGEGGYQVGNFPPGWAEWNGMYRDCIRDYWRGTEQVLPEFAKRFAGSPDLYQNTDRTPATSINFVTAHDGFTLHDLVSYNEKHNEANGENNADGSNENRCTNWGAEGDTDQEEIIQHRKRHKRNLLATLFLSQGVPMLLSGDEIGNSQKGNNNTYCQDNELGWINWENKDEELLEFTRWLIAFRKKHPSFCRHGWFQSLPIHGEQTNDIAWFLPEGQEMSDEHWQTGMAKSLGIYLNGRGFHYCGPKGETITDDHFYIIFNGHSEPVNFTLPSESYSPEWTNVLDTGVYSVNQEETSYKAGDIIPVKAHSVMLFSHALG